MRSSSRVLLVLVAAAPLLAAGAGAGTRCPQTCPAPLFEAPGGGPIHDTGGIVEAFSGTFELNGRTLGYAFFRNREYPCGAEGLHNFLVLEPQWGPEVKHLWTLVPPGGTGYFDQNETDPDKLYYTAGPNPKTDGLVENTEVAPLVDLLDRQLRAPGSFLAPLADSGAYRFMMPSGCDHDVFLGMGEHTDPEYFYPRNPHRPDDRVEGLLALLSAIEFTATSRATDLVFLHGTSAGSYGVYGAAYALEQQGRAVNGLILDSGLATARFEDLYFDFPPEDGPCLSGQLSNPDIDLCQTQEKNGPLFCDHSLYAEASVTGPDSLDIPLYDLVSRNDRDCCGQVEPWLEEAIALGGNCEYVHGELAAELEQKGDPLQVSRVYAGGDHVLTERAGPWQDDLADWLAAVLAAEPRAPWPVAENRDP